MGTGRNAVQWKLSRLPMSSGENQPKTDIVIAIVGCIVIAIGNAAITGIVIPIAAAQHAVLTYTR